MSSPQAWNFIQQKSSSCGFPDDLCAFVGYIYNVQIFNNKMKIFREILSPLIAVVAAFIVGGIIVTLIGDNPFETFGLLLGNSDCLLNGFLSAYCKSIKSHNIDTQVKFLAL